MTQSKITDAILAEVTLRGSNPYRTAVDLGLPEDAIRYIKQGRDIRASRLVQICDALGLEFYIGPPRQTQDHGKQPPVFQAWAPDPPPNPRLVGLLARVADGWESLKADECVRLQRAVDADLELAGATRGGRFGPILHRLLLGDPHLALAPSAEEDGGLPDGRPVAMYELGVAAGGGAVDIDEAPLKGNVWFRREWLDRRGLDPTQCVVISVRGTSMEPTLMDGCSILVARHRTRRREGRVYVAWTEDGLIVKRAGRGEDGEWMLMSDAGPPDWPPVPWPRDAAVKGEVIWTARALVAGRVAESGYRQQ